MTLEAEHPSVAAATYLPTEWRNPVAFFTEWRHVFADYASHFGGATSRPGMPMEFLLVPPLINGNRLTVAWFARGNYAKGFPTPNFYLEIAWNKKSWVGGVGFNDVNKNHNQRHNFRYPRISVAGFSDPGQLFGAWAKDVRITPPYADRDDTNDLTQDITKMFETGELHTVQQAQRLVPSELERAAQFWTGELIDDFRRNIPGGILSLIMRFLGR